MRRPVHPSFDNELEGVGTIARLFAFCFRRAFEGLQGADVALLLRTEPGAVASLGWSTAAELAALQGFFLDLAARDQRHRHRVRRAERETFRSRIEAISDRARAMFLSAHAVDEAYSGKLLPADPLDPAVSLRPTPFLDDGDEAPPSLGQMTPIAACRRWMRTFWYLGDTRHLEAFGPALALTPLRAPALLEQALQRACDDDELRIGLVAYRRHELSGLVVQPRTGRFAVEGVKGGAPAGLLRGVVDALCASRVHIAVFPELALDPSDEQDLRGCLQATARRYPCLTVAGLTHRVREDDAYANEAVALDSAGEELFRYEKVEPFTHSTLGMEDILPRRSLAYPYLDTPVGRLVVNVCRDVRSDMPMLLNRVLGASLVAIPAYSKRLDFIIEEARLLGARQSAITVGINPVTGTASSPGPLDDVAAVYAPIRGATRCTWTLSARDLASPERGDAPVQVVAVSRAGGARSLRVL